MIIKTYAMKVSTSPFIITTPMPTITNTIAIEYKVEIKVQAF